MERMEDGGIHTNYKCPILNRGEEERKLDLNGGVCLGGGGGVRGRACSRTEEPDQRVCGREGEVGDRTKRPNAVRGRREERTGRHRK